MTLHDAVIAATRTGLVDLRRPDPAKISLAAIAHGLAGLNRWTHATERPVSVAQHSLIVFEIFTRAWPALRPQAVHALLHDAHEYVLGDITWPLEALLDGDMPGLRHRIAHWKALWDSAIRMALDVPELEPDRDMRLLAAIAEADLLAADLEWRLWMPADNGPSPYADRAGRAPRHGYRPGAIMGPADAELSFAAAVQAELQLRPWERRP